MSIYQEKKRKYIFKAKNSDRRQGWIAAFTMSRLGFCLAVKTVEDSSTKCLNIVLYSE